MDALQQWMATLPPWLNLKACVAIVIIGAGLWFLFTVLGEVVKIIIALAIIGAGLFLLARVMNWM